MKQETRNKLRNVVTQCRRLLEESVSQDLEGKFGIFAKKDVVTADPNAKMPHLSEEEQAARKDILDHFEHIKARGFKPKDALDQLVREIAFTHLNRLCAYKMMEAREVYVGGQKFREAVSRGVNSNGVKFYLADHPEDERLFNTGHQDAAYRHFLNWLGGLLSDEIGVLFDPNDSANRIYPRQKTLDEVLDLLNNGGIKPEETELREEWPKIWSQDETIGWVYQYFTPKELKDAARDPKKGGSQAPRNSYELAFRNQFFTPRYVVEFLTDNTLGRIWYELRNGDTKLRDRCRYMVRRPAEIFLNEGEQPPKDVAERRDDLSQEELLKLPVYIPHRPKKDPRELRILDPASGSGHFLLYCFDLLLTIYEEAYNDPALGLALQKDYPTLEDLLRELPRLILTHNLHGIDIDLRASQIAALALWLRCQRAYQEMGLKKDRPAIRRSNFVCAEPMPGEEQMLKEFVSQLEPKFLGQVVEVVFEKMKLAGEAGSLLKIEEEIRDAVAAAKKQWITESTRATDRKGQPLLFTQVELDRIAGKPGQASLFDLSGITDAQFFEQAEAKVIETLRQYAERTRNGQRLRRHLFADDAMRGFAFVDLCHKQFDVVLMNPPFGLFPEKLKSYFSLRFDDGKADIAAVAVERGKGMLSDGGLLGAITTRTLLVLPTFEDWRSKNVLRNEQLRLLADLGYGVLDEAVVEAAAYVLSSCSTLPAVFCNCLESLDKAGEMLSSIVSLIKAYPKDSIQVRFPTEFLNMPASVIAYQVPSYFATRLASWSSLESLGVSARKGLNTSDDERFLRTAWEVPAPLVGQGKRWVHFAKGGEWNPFWDDIYLLVDWQDQGQSIISEGGTIRNASSYFRSGLTYPQRTTSSFGPRVLPEGCIYSTGGMAIHFGSECDALCYLGLLLSRPGQLLIEMSLGGGDSSMSGTAARNYTNGMVNRLPFPSISAIERNTIADTTCQIVLIVKSFFDSDELARTFRTPIAKIGSTLRETAALEEQVHLEKRAALVPLVRQLELSSQRLFGMTSERDEKVLDLVVGPSVFAISESQAASSIPLASSERAENAVAADWATITESELIAELCRKRGKGARYVTKNSQLIDRKLELLAVLHNHSIGQVIRLSVETATGSSFVKPLTVSFFSYALGCVYGRWDIRRYFEKPNEALGNPFAALPPYSPGMLQSTDGILVNTPKDYPVEVQESGILVDDPSHSCDIVRRVQTVLDVIWKNRADMIEKEACEVLDIKELREYFRRVGKGGFWDDHISRYSKSRRKAPIYWLLQSSRKNYALWLYCHRFDKDLLFKALVNYVEPKIRLETNRLETLRSQIAAIDISGKDSKRLAKELEGQGDFLSELRDFEDKLRRAANLHLVPDLNDGVVLNIAPLHELVPWKEAAVYWDELLEGKYEWSSISKQLRQKGLVK